MGKPPLEIALPTGPERARRKTPSVAKRHVPSTDFALRALRTAADLHRACRDPQQWRDAFASFRSLVGCANSLPDAPETTDDPEQFIAECVAWIMQCRRPDARGCWADHCEAEVQEQLCLLLVEHLAIALDNALLYRKTARKVSATAALDAFDRPLIVFDGKHQLVHANHLGHAELASRRWIGVVDDRLLVGPSAIEKQFAVHVAALSGKKRLKSTHLQIRLADGETLEIRLRRILHCEGSPPVFLLSQVTVANSSESGSVAPGDELDALAQATPRQHELARLLLAGATLTDAAARMGISRATANGHLKKLFEFSNTTRQTELVAWLTRTIHF
jgi:DNA-binding CsgD family transcriptional regulator